MRIWSIHPQYLDTKGLIALWREALLAKLVLEGKTKGYKNHPQLKRFKSMKNPLEGINQYLSIVYLEAIKRGYNFDKNKINWNFKSVKVLITSEQVKYEKNHLINKLKTRDPSKYNSLIKLKECMVHPLFEIVEGEIEEWEIVK